MNRINAHREEAPESSPTSFHNVRTQKTTASEPGSGVSPDTKYTEAVIWDFLAPRIVR